MSSSQRSVKAKAAPATKGNPVAVRPKSSRCADKENEFVFPKNHRFLVYFYIDGKFDLVKPDHSGWPTHLSSSVKLSLQYEDVLFKSDKNPKDFLNGLVITNGPENILVRVGDKMNAMLNEGIKPRDMNLTKVFAEAHLEIQNEKQNDIFVNNKDKDVDNAESDGKSDSDDWIDDDTDDNEPDQPEPEVRKSKSASKTPANSELTANQVVNIFFFPERYIVSNCSQTKQLY